MDLSKTASPRFKRWEREEKRWKKNGKNTIRRYVHLNSVHVKGYPFN